ncbi:hypothetical protein BGX33_011762 [Mortierella sp. NVP41]|nr:hypothetical protein BGX33_011762 [Mortierella sp. NVP41]
MNVISDLIHTVAGLPNQANLNNNNTQTQLQPQPSQPELVPQQEQQELGHELEFQKSLVTASSLAPQSPATASTMPPEIIQLIINYLDNRDLVKVITLNWTWAHLAAPRLWHQIDYTVQSSRIFFLITKSVAPPGPDKVPPKFVFAPPPSSTLPAGSDTDMSSVPPVSDSMAPLSSSPSLAETGFTSVPPNSIGEAISEDRPLPPKRRHSYPWPTLLPYHSMVHTLNISLSTADMVQDLLELIPCCIELRSFALHSAIPTEDLLIRGVIASACNDALDPLNPVGGTTIPGHSTSATSMASLIQGAHTSHSHSHSLSLDPYNSSTNPRAGLQEADDETIMAASTSQSGMLFKLLSQSCPRLEKICFSGFHPVSVLGSSTDLRPRPSLKHHLSTQLAESLVVKPPVTADAIFPPTTIIGTLSSSPSASTAGTVTMDVSLPPIPPVPGINASVPLSASTSPSIAAASTNQQQIQSKIHSVQFVNCTLPPQYLLAMIQHSLPNLTSLALTQCWQGNPLTGSFLTSLAKISPGLKEITLHATQNHRDCVTSDNLLQMLQGLEGKSKDRDEEHLYYGSSTATTGASRPQGIGASMADFPLDTFRKTSYTTGGAPSVSSVAATIGSSSFASHSNSNSSSSSALVTLPALSSSSSSIADSFQSPLASPSSSPSSYMANGSTSHAPVGNGFLSAQAPYTSHQQQQQQHQPTFYLGADETAKGGSDLESISVWFTHSTLDQLIAAELGNRARHPRLRRVEFGSEDAFDVGEDLIRRLGEQREELDVTWVNFGDTGDDRDD